MIELLFKGGTYSPSSSYNTKSSSSELSLFQIKYLLPLNKWLFNNNQRTFVTYITNTGQINYTLNFFDISKQNSVMLLKSSRYICTNLYTYITKKTFFVSWYDTSTRYVLHKSIIFIIKTIYRNILIIEDYSLEISKQIITNPR